MLGKSLLKTELLSLFDQETISEYERQGLIIGKPSLQTENGKKSCNRCGTDRPYHFHQHPCSRCKSDCIYCRNCIMMGKCRSCEMLYSWNGSQFRYPSLTSPLVWDGALSEGQEAASRQVQEAIRKKMSCLVWAVCGAGKTEVLFAGIAQALSNGERVCIATPRTDVVLELAPRLKKVFPGVSSAALYGGSEEKGVPAQLIISTTHQLLRYEQAFDTLIIDEVDAFPYSIDASLQYAAAKARKKASSLIYLTATPSAKMRREAAKERLPYTTIPARFHRRPIPVPRLVWTGNWKKVFAKQIIPKKLELWLESKLRNNIPFLIFFPTIALMKEKLPLFQRKCKDVQMVYAEDPDRIEKVTSLRTGSCPGLLTTTILERGVTVPRLQVAVIGAEEDIFTESALVQIAGRTGRSKEDTAGEAVFFHHGKTRAMVKAVRQIEEMNLLAAERKLLDE